MSEAKDSLKLVLTTKTCVIELFNNTIKCSNVANYGLFEIQNKFICEFHKENFEQITKNKLLDFRITDKCFGCLENAPLFNTNKANIGIFCQTCADNYMTEHPNIKLIDVIHKKCIKCAADVLNGNQYCQNCSIKTPKRKKCTNCDAESFYVNREKTIYLCNGCKKYDATPDLIRMNRKCFNCTKNGSYRAPDGLMYCRKCADKEPDGKTFKDVIHQMCETCEKVQASYGFPNENKVKYCGKCAKDTGAVDLKNGICKNCNKVHAHYNYASESKPIYCFNCKKKDMIAFQSHKCQGFDKKCNTRPIFGYKGTKNALYCKECAEKWGTHFVNVTDNMCEHCHIVRPTFGIKDGKPTHCRQCSDLLKLNLIDVKTKRCIVCKNTKPTFGIIIPAGQACIFGPPTHCFNCKEPHFIDVHHKKCIECLKEGKYTRAEYAKLLNIPIHCFEHRAPGEINTPNPRCSCGAKATEGPKNTYIPIRCITHSFDDDISFDTFKCACGNTDSYAPGDLEPKCVICRNADIKTRVKQKELAIKKLFDDNELNYHSYDKPVEDGCNMLRPDFVFNSKVNHNVIIVEVDEYQHTRTGYNTDCETVRMINLKQGFCQRAVTFIRYNPDIFYNNKRPQFISDENRHKLLIALLKKLLNEPAESKYVLDAYYMFYNDQREDNGIYEPIHRIILNKESTHLH